MRTLDLFCGCGGLSLGFELAGFELVAAADNWPEALAVYRQNFQHPALLMDLSDVENALAQLAPLRPEVVIGGPPCQDFSSAGKRDEDNGKGALTVAYARLVAGLSPSIFVMENVPTIVGKRKLQEAKAILQASGYGLSSTVLDASLCGVPQRRKRFFMVGILGGKDGELLPTLQGGLARVPLTVRQALGNEITVDYYYRHPRSYARRGIFSVDEPSPTVRGVNRPMPPGYQLHSNDAVQTKEGIQPLTTLQRARIQTFPADFCWNGPRTVVEQLVGNAVPVKLAQHVAERLLTWISTEWAYK